MKALVDTCIIIDALQNRQPFAKDSEAICLAAAGGKFSGYLTANTITDIYYLLHRYLHNKETVRANIENLCRSFNILDTTGADCENALRSSVPDFEDAVMVETGRRNHMDCIVTRNIKDYANAPVRICTPAEFLKEIE